MIRFHKYIWLYFLISLSVISVGLFSLIRFGYRFSIDYTGGTILSYSSTKEVNRSEVERILDKSKIKHLSVSNYSIDIRMSPLNENEELTIRTNLQNILKTKIQLKRFETVGPVLGKETTQKTIIAAFCAIIGMLIYMSFAFKNVNFALSAIVALFHDFLVLMGSYSLLSYFFGAEFDLLFVTALLTTMSFSVHDTIVIFDKIREYTRIGGRQREIEYLADKAISETLVRSLNNSLTIMFMLVALLVLGGVTTRFFVAALLIGTVTGVYSSPFVATPFLLFLEKRKKKK